jgi:shikimate kinase
MSNLYLVGFMGAGKSSVGRMLARRLNRPFIDLDRHIEETAATPIGRIFETEGEAAFRMREREALGRVCEMDDVVVATGGGAICDADNREIMHRAGGCTLFLDVPWSALAARLAQDHDGRPMFTTEDDARRLYEARRPHYETASFTVELRGDEDGEQVVSLVLETLAGTACAT